MKATKRMTQTELAAAAGLSWGAVHRHVVKAGLRPDRRGRYDLAAFSAALAQHREADKAAQGGPVAEARRKKLEVETQILQVALGEKMGLLMLRQAALDHIAKLLAELKSRLFAIPSKVATRCQGKSAPEIKELLDAEFRWALSQPPEDPGSS